MQGTAEGQALGAARRRSSRRTATPADAPTPRDVLKRAIKLQREGRFAEARELCRSTTAEPGSELDQVARLNEAICAIHLGEAASMARPVISLLRAFPESVESSVLLVALICVHDQGAFALARRLAVLLSRETRKSQELPSIPAVVTPDRVIGTGRSERVRVILSELAQGAVPEQATEIRGLEQAYSLGSA